MRPTLNMIETVAALCADTCFLGCDAIERKGYVTSVSSACPFC